MSFSLGTTHVPPGPDLVLAAGKTGLEALRAVRADAATRTVPVVFILGSEPDVAAIYRIGANSCIRRPASAEEGASILEHLVSYWLILNVRAPGPLPPRP